MVFRSERPRALLPPLQLSVARTSTRRALILIVALIGVVLGSAVPVFRLHDSGEQRFLSISDRAQATVHAALNKVSPKRLVAPKRLWQVDLDASNSHGTPLVRVGQSAALATAKFLSSEKWFRNPIRAPPLPSNWS
jgi:hypothetical protein